MPLPLKRASPFRSTGLATRGFALAIGQLRSKRCGRNQPPKLRTVEDQTRRYDPTVTHLVPFGCQDCALASRCIKGEFVEGAYVLAILPLMQQLKAAHDWSQTGGAAKEGILTFGVDKRTREGKVVGDEATCSLEVRRVKRT